ncbi:putative disease resistance RPP13-like protein 1 [Vitis vinifera]|uniref:Putative disease resistance RPP13-like protein 1 n=1 Tax=Vitis vinifera TaxID=29760 RepID=A0A438J6S1_VITVI|nr:putative disease resistance RPP13-like protein 1 [Vitis vinifera]
MNFMSYVAEVSRGWDEPNARVMGRMKSQPNAKGEMYILNDGIDMKAKIAAMAWRLEELEMKKMQEVQAISQTPLQSMPCAICLSYEHLVDKCPTIPAPPQYQQPAQVLPQASNLEQAMVNLSKMCIRRLVASHTLCLRVLSLCGYWIVDLPDSMGNLKCLRFLNLSHTPIKRLPESVCSLYNLQIILLSNCRRLCELPRGLKKLINLRYLRIRDSGIKEMPDHIGQLRNLQELSRFIVGQTSGRRIGELRGLSEIRGRLHISELQNVVCGMDALEANLKDKKYVDDLVLEWKSNSDVLQNGIDIVNNLQPHENVKRLTVNSYGGTRFPDWLGDRLFLNMVFLNLKNCQHCSSLPSLGQLSSA